MSFAHLSKRYLSTLIDVKGKSQPRDFSLFPDFFTISEQRILLTTALHQLDSMESRPFRRRRDAFIRDRANGAIEQSQSLRDLFLPDEYYKMEEGHYDGVIHHYREMHITWPETEVPGLPALLKRLHNLCPTPNIQTHILHLASDGEILPHIDNIQASGTWILGVSLGAERIMRMEGTDCRTDSFDVLLPSGSVYIQRDTVRFGYNHSILKEGSFLGREIKRGPRLSIMIRDRLPLEQS